MSPVLVDAVIAAVSLGLFAAAYGGALFATRPARVRAAPATPDLGAEPPAVVSLLANRWRLTEDASESTVLDLAARGQLELRQPGNDPRHTTVHLREADQPATELLPYERRVLDRVRDLAVQGVVPVTALTFREANLAKRWNKRLHQEVIHDARARGLSRRRLSVAAVGIVSAVAVLSAAGLSVVGLRVSWRDGDIDPVGSVWIGVIAFAILSGIAGRPHGERDTPTGRQVAARWLGVRAWLRAHEEFADLPPAAVAVWDRYLPYGAALGVTHTASEVLDLGMGDRRLVWSSYGGAWRRVRVRYPKLLPRYGRPAPGMLVRGALAAAAGVLLVRTFGLPAAGLPDLSKASGVPEDPFVAFEVATDVLPLLAVLLLAYGGYLLVRTLLDLVTTRTVTGEVLWVEVWRAHQRKNRGSVPWLDYLAIDDGSADRARAWGLPRELTTSVRARDVVTIRVRPWTRRIVALTVVERGRTHALTDASVAEDGSEVAATLLAALVGGGTAARAAPTVAAQLLSVEEVSQALGLPVREPQPMPVPGVLAAAVFTSADRGRQVLMVGLVSGRYGEWVWRRFSGHAALPGIGDGAHVDGERGAVQVGDAIVVLTLLGAGRARREQLPWLLHRAALRLPRQHEPAA